MLPLVMKWETHGDEMEDVVMGRWYSRGGEDGTVREMEMEGCCWEWRSSVGDEERCSGGPWMMV